MTESIEQPRERVEVEPGQWRKKPVVVEAHQWWANGDHPADYTETIPDPDGDHTPEERRRLGWEGDVVRYYRHPDVDGQTVHTDCGHLWHDHGWIDTLEGGHTVCPGDVIITGVEGERYPCKPRIFLATYERA